MKERDFDRFLKKEGWDSNTIERVKEWERKTWGGVSVKDTLTEFVKCKSRESVKKRG